MLSAMSRHNSWKTGEASSIINEDQPHTPIFIAGEVHKGRCCYLAAHCIHLWPKTKYKLDRELCLYWPVMMAVCTA